MLKNLQRNENGDGRTPCLKHDYGMCKICTLTSSADDGDYDDDDCDAVLMVIH